MTDLTGNAQYDAITTAIREFSWDNYGLDDVDPNSEYAEWVPDLAGAIHKAIGEREVAQAGSAELEQLRAARARTIAQMESYSTSGSGGVNPRQVINLLSLTWPDGNYEVAPEGDHG
jgi:hypothetical protein